MKTNKLTIFALGASLGLAGAVHGQTVFYSEDFTGQNGKGAFGNSNDGITTDTSGVDWMIDISGAGLDGDTTTNDWRVIDEAFEGQDMGGLSIWFSPIVDVSGFTQITDISLDVEEFGGAANAGSEGFSFAYSLDGGTNFFDIFSTGFDGDNTDGSTTITTTPQTISLASPVSIGTDTDFQIRVQADINGANDGYIFDNISGTAVPEPNAYALLAGLLGLGYVMVRRRRA